MNRPIRLTADVAAGIGRDRRRRGDHGWATISARAWLVVGLAAVSLATAACGGTAAKLSSGTATSGSATFPSTSSVSPATPGAITTRPVTRQPTTPSSSTDSVADTSTTTTPAGSTGPANSPPASPSPPQAGTYLYRQSGSSTAGGQTQPVPAQGSIRIDPAAAQGAAAWTQTWHSYVDPSQPPSDTTYEFSPGGVGMVSIVTRADLNSQSLSFTCTFSPPLEVTPWPPTVGYAFSGEGSCGSFTASVTGRIDGTQPVTLDGQAITTYVIDATITTHGSVSLTDHEIDWFSPTMRLLVHTSDDEQGTYGLVSFSSRVTRDLESARRS
jgi:hypothetical protein